MVCLVAVVRNSGAGADETLPSLFCWLSTKGLVVRGGGAHAVSSVGDLVGVDRVEIVIDEMCELLGTAGGRGRRRSRSSLQPGQEGGSGRIVTERLRCWSREAHRCGVKWPFEVDEQGVRGHA